MCVQKNVRHTKGSSKFVSGKYFPQTNIPVPAKPYQAAFLLIGSHGDRLKAVFRREREQFLFGASSVFGINPDALKIKVFASSGYALMVLITSRYKQFSIKEVITRSVYFPSCHLIIIDCFVFYVGQIIDLLLLI